MRLEGAEKPRLALRAARAARIAAVLSVLACTVPAAALSAEGPAMIRGRLVDGTALARGVKPEDLQGGAASGAFLASVQRMPLANRKFRLHLTAGPESGRSWEGTTDGEGRFSLPLDVRGLPTTPCLVAGIEGTPALYSAAVSPSAEEVEFRAYQTTESDRILRGSVLHVFHYLVPNPVAERVDLEVRVQFQLFNASGEMYVGRPVAPRFWKWKDRPPSREVLRVPVPAEASIVMNSGPRGARWSEFPGDGSWKWMVIDAPILPYTETSGEGFRESWEVTYRLPASQDTVAVYPLGLKPSAFAAWGREDELALESDGLLHKSQEMNSLRAGEPPQKCTVLFSQDEEILPGKDITIGVHVDNAKLGEVNRGSLWVILAFAGGTVAAILAGLFLSRKGGPPLETVLEEATGEELIARIAQLDQRWAAKDIAEKEYRETRAKLLAMARYLVPELQGAEGAAPGRSAGAPGGAEAADGLPPAAGELLERLKGLESEGPLDSHRIHERALLLEELARLLTSRASARERKTRGVER